MFKNIADIICECPLRCASSSSPSFLCALPDTLLPAGKDGRRSQAAARRGPPRGGTAAAAACTLTWPKEEGTKPRRIQGDVLQV